MVVSEERSAEQRKGEKTRVKNHERVELQKQKSDLLFRLHFIT
jgi:hypothetical protein